MFGVDYCCFDWCDVIVVDIGWILIWCYCWIVKC